MLEGYAILLNCITMFNCLNKPLKLYHNVYRVKQTSQALPNCFQGYTNFLTLPQCLQGYTNLLNFTTVFAGFHKSVKLYHIVYNLQIFSTLIGQKSRKNELKRYNMIFISFLYSKGVTVSFGD